MPEAVGGGWCDGDEAPADVAGTESGGRGPHDPEPTLRRRYAPRPALAFALRGETAASAPEGRAGLTAKHPDRARQGRGLGTPRRAARAGACRRRKTTGTARSRGADRRRHREPRSGGRDGLRGPRQNGHGHVQGAGGGHPVRPADRAAVRPTPPASRRPLPACGPPSEESPEPGSPPPRTRDARGSGKREGADPSRSIVPPPGVRASRLSLRRASTLHAFRLPCGPASAAHPCRRPRPSPGSAPVAWGGATAAGGRSGASCPEAPRGPSVRDLPYYIEMR